MGMTITLDNNLSDRLQKLAADLHTSPSEIIRDLLDHADKRAVFYRDGIAAEKHFQETGLHVSEEEMDAWFEKLEAGEDQCLPPLGHAPG